MHFITLREKERERKKHDGVYHLKAVPACLPSLTMAQETCLLPPQAAEMGRVNSVPSLEQQCQGPNHSSSLVGKALTGGPETLAPGGPMGPVAPLGPGGPCGERTNRLLRNDLKPGPFRSEMMIGSQTTLCCCHLVPGLHACSPNNHRGRGSPGHLFLQLSQVVPEVPEVPADGSPVGYLLP